MDTAWGRRVYDQYEIEFEVDKPKHSYLSEPSSKMVNFGHKAELIERQRIRRTLGNYVLLIFQEKQVFIVYN